MNNLIKKLYEGNLCPMEQSSVILKHCQEKAGRSFEKLLEKMDEDSKRTLEMFMDAYSEFTALESEQSFSRGFILGIKLMCEVFMQENMK